MQRRVSRFVASRSAPEEQLDLFEKPLRRRLIFLEEMVLARQSDEPSTGNARRQRPTPLDEHQRIFPRVHHEGGADTLGRTPRTSKLLAASTRRAAISGAVVLRCSSLKKSICSCVAPGMNSCVYICRNARLFAPHPRRISSPWPVLERPVNRFCSYLPRTHRTE